MSDAEKKRGVKWILKNIDKVSKFYRSAKDIPESTIEVYLHLSRFKLHCTMGKSEHDALEIPKGFKSKAKIIKWCNDM